MEILTNREQLPEGVTTVDGKKAGEEFQPSTNLWNQNPYWAAHQFIHDNTRDRFITSGNLRFDITSFLYIQGRLGMDYYTRKSKDLDSSGYRLSAWRCCFRNNADSKGNKPGMDSRI